MSPSAAALLKESSPINWKTNWIELCKFGEAHNFKTIVTLQPFLGGGNKLLTDNEYSMYKSYGFPVILDEYYVNYVEQLDEINQNCAAAYDLRYVFDTYLGSIYWDYVHVGNSGNEIIAKIFYEIVNDNIKNSDNGKNNINKFSSSQESDFLPPDSAYNLPELLLDKIKAEKIELSNKDYSDQNLAGKNFFADHIKDTDFSNANLVGADFRFANLDNVNFTNADLTEADFSSATIINSDFTGADLTNVYASRAVITDGFFHNTNLSGVFLVGAEIACAAFQEYDSKLMHEMVSRYDCISKTNFENANLSYAHLFNLDLYNSKVEI